MRCGSRAHLGLARGVPHRRGRGGPSSTRRGFGRARLVGSALVAQHAGAGDLGGAGDGRRRRRPAAPLLGVAAAAAGAAVTETARDGRRATQRTHPRARERHSSTYADGNLQPASPAGQSRRRRTFCANYDSL